MQGYSQVDNVRQKFTAYERDDEIGLNFAQARYQSAAQGRFTSVDPGNLGANLFAPQSWNGYTYVENNPTNLIDPSGLSSADPGTPPGCSAEFSYEQCGGDSGFWGGKFGDDVGMYSDLRGMPSNVRSSLLQYEYNISNATYGGGTFVVDYFPIWYWIYDDGSMETIFRIDGGQIGGYNPAWELAQEMNRRPVAKTFGVLYGGSVVAGASAGGVLAWAGGGGIGTTITTLGLSGGQGSATSSAALALAHVESTIARALANPSTRGLAKELIKHRDKLAEYAKNPFAYDNKGILRSAPTADRAANIISGRVKHLIKEIKALWDQIK